MTTKSIIKIGYTEYVADTDKATAFLELFSELEMYDDKWHSGTDGSPGYHSHHVWPQEEIGMAAVKLLPMSIYNVAKLAGKPEK